MHLEASGEQAYDGGAFDSIWHSQFGEYDEVAYHSLPAPDDISGQWL